MPLYRNRQQPYPKPAGAEFGLLPVLHNNPPHTWINSQPECDLYQQIYGKAALVKAVLDEQVCESRDPVWVGGTAMGIPEKLAAARNITIWWDDEVVPEPSIPVVLQPSNAELAAKLDKIIALLTILAGK